MLDIEQFRFDLWAGTHLFSFKTMQGELNWAMSLVTNRRRKISDCTFYL